MTADAVIVLAKEPLPGRVKTRLSPAFSPVEAAELAAASLRDTFAAVKASGVSCALLSWQGDPRLWQEGFAVARQPDGGLGVRLAAAFDQVFALPDAPAGPRGAALLIGMDTPQVTPELLHADWGGVDAVLGLSDDGGFWAIGLRRDHPAGIFDGVPMSTERTGAAQLARLVDLGLSVTLLPPLLDVDTAVAAEQIAYEHPWLQFSQAYAAIVARRPEQDWARVFDRLFGVHGSVDVESGAALTLEVGRWAGDADEVDALVVLRCQPPVLDLGCGPGRMVRALAANGQPALGVDISAVAVQLSLARGAPAIRRELAQRLPAEGRWGTALLMDGNIGIGGDVRGLLRRCRRLVVAGGLIVCEVDPDPDADEVTAVTLRGDGVSAPPMPWARIGSRALQRLAVEQDLLVEEEWSSGRRCFVALRSTS